MSTAQQEQPQPEAFERPNVDLRSIWANEDQTFTAQGGRTCTYSIKMLDAVLGAAFANAPQQEKAAFLAYCMHKGLDPVSKQVYFIKYDKSKPASFVTAWEVFLERAQSHPQYDGFENGIVWRIKDGDGWRMEKAGAVAYLRDADHVIAGGWATVYRKGNRPLTVEVPLSEMSSNNTKWNTETTTMSVKTPTARALRQQFTESLGGIYGENESERFTADMVADKSEALPSGSTVPPKDLDELMFAEDEQAKEVLDDDNPFVDEDDAEFTEAMQTEIE